MTAARTAVLCVLTPFVAPAAQALILTGSFPVVTEGDAAVDVTIGFPIQVDSNDLGLTNGPGITVMFDSTQVSVTFDSTKHRDVDSCGVGCVHAAFGHTDFKNQFLLYSALADMVAEPAPSPTTITFSHRRFTGPTGLIGEASTTTFTVNVNDPTPGLVLAQPTLLSLAEGATAFVMVKLATQPAAGVVVNISVSDDTELSVEPTSLTFNSDNWSAPKAVVLSGVADSEVDDAQQVVVTYSFLGDSVYSALPDVTRDVEVTNVDAGLVLAPDALAALAEGETATVMAKLATQPDSLVAVGVTVSDSSELSVTPPLLVLLFLPSNWNTAQPVVLTGETDNVVDGTQAVVVTYDFMSLAAIYSDLPSVTQDVDVTDVDVAEPGLVLDS